MLGLLGGFLDSAYLWVNSVLKRRKGQLQFPKGLGSDVERVYRLGDELMLSGRGGEMLKEIRMVRDPPQEEEEEEEKEGHAKRKKEKEEEDLLEKAGVRIWRGKFKSPVADILEEEHTRWGRVEIIEPIVKEKEDEEGKEECEEKGKRNGTNSGTSSKCKKIRGIVVHLPATGDEYFQRRRKQYALPLAARGYVSVLLMAPYYGDRRPTGQSSFESPTVSHFMAMGLGIAAEGAALVRWARERWPGVAVGIKGVSMGACLGMHSALLAGGDMFLVCCVPATGPHNLLDSGYRHLFDWEGIARERREQQAMNGYGEGVEEKDKEGKGPCDDKRSVEEILYERLAWYPMIKSFERNHQCVRRSLSGGEEDEAEAVVGNCELCTKGEEDHDVLHKRKRSGSYGIKSSKSPKLEAGLSSSSSSSFSSSASSSASFNCADRGQRKFAVVAISAANDQIVKATYSREFHELVKHICTNMGFSCKETGCWEETNLRNVNNSNEKEKEKGGDEAAVEDQESLLYRNRFIPGGHVTSVLFSAQQFVSGVDEAVEMLEKQQELQRGVCCKE
eukprot:Nk52_evm24s2402 gene=Nk52_evmTU24s2402